MKMILTESDCDTVPNNEVTNHVEQPNLTDSKT